MDPRLTALVAHADELRKQDNRFHRDVDWAVAEIKRLQAYIRDIAAQADNLEIEQQIMDEKMQMLGEKLESAQVEIERLHAELDKRHELVLRNELVQEAREAARTIVREELADCPATVADLVDRYPWLKEEE